MDRVITFAQALAEATDQEMARDPHVFVMGQGADDHKAIFGTTKGLVEKYGAKRVFDTPLAEDGMTGLAIGAALSGMRPIHTHIRMDFVVLAMNQIVNMAAKMRSMFGGAVNVPLVVRAAGQGRVAGVRASASARVASSRWRRESRRGCVGRAIRRSSRQRNTSPPHSRTT